MKKCLLIPLFLFFATCCFGQNGISAQQINQVVTALTAAGETKENIKSTIDGIIKSPDLYNTFWKGFIDQAYKADSTKWKFLRDINVQLKTFEAQGTAPAGLGFTYDYNHSYAKFVQKGQNRISQSFDFSANGNVAFKKELNPYNLLETKIDYSYSFFSGGVVKVSNTSYYKRLDLIEDTLATIKDMQSVRARSLWEEFGKYLQLSNQYYYGVSPQFGFESNHDDNYFL